MRAFYRALRILSAVTLFFFCWTFLPLWQAVAYAATDSRQSTVDSQKQPATADSRLTTGDRFEKALESIRENIGKAEEKSAKNQDVTAEVAEVKTQRTEIEKIDVELRKEFAATEKKLKDANLPQEILDRHYKFVKHYEDNLAELKANLDGHEKAQKAQDKVKAREYIRKAKLHLEKTKPPRKHVPLDPNKLPFRTVKAKERAPRLKKEEFEREFGPQRHQGTKTADYRLPTEFIATDSHPRLNHSGTGLWPRIKAIGRPRSVSNMVGCGTEKDAQETQKFGRELTRIGANGFQKTAHKQKPILVAANGPLTGLLSSKDQPPLPLGERTEVRGFDPAFTLSASTLNSELGTLNLAAVDVDLPTSADLSETPEVQFTPEIRDLAAQLNYSPVKIYEWVRNNIEFVPTYGSIQGAQLTLEAKQGNAFDTASLLIALLRASGIAARYVYGTVEIQIEKAMNWVGGVTDPKMVGTIFATNGIPAKMLISGGAYKAVQLEHVYVSAFIDYLPSRGAVHRQGDTWISLDPSFKQYTYTQGIDIKSAVSFDTQAFIEQVKSSTTINESESYIANVDTQLVRQTVQEYQVRVQKYLADNYSNATIKDIIGRKTINKSELPYIMGTLPYQVIEVATEYSQVPAGLRATMNVSIQDIAGSDIGFIHDISLQQGAEEKVTISFSPATAIDQQVIESYFSRPHIDNSPIHPTELPPYLPAYLINLKPELRINGQVVASGAPITMGKALTLSISINEPGIGTSTINNIITTGQYFAIGLDTGRVGAGRLNKLKEKIFLTKGKIETQNYENITADNFLGDFFSAVILYYFTALDAADEIEAKIRNIIRYRTPSVGMFGISLNIQNIFGLPKSVGPDSVIMDVDRIVQAVFSKDGNQAKIRQYMLASGTRSSALEHSVPEHTFLMPDNSIIGISAVKALQIAASQGMPIYSISRNNVDSILPKLQIADEIKADIINAVAAGKIVTVSQTNIIYEGWTGCGYVIFDPMTGAGAYLISGIYSGMKLLGAALYLLAVMFFLVAVLTASTIIGPIIFGTLGLLASYGMIVALYGREKADEFVLCVLQAFLPMQIEDILLEVAETIAEVMGTAMASYFSGLNWVVTGVDFLGCLSELQSIDPIIDPIPYQYA